MTFWTTIFHYKRFLSMDLRCGLWIFSTPLPHIWILNLTASTILFSSFPVWIYLKFNFQKSISIIIDALSCKKKTCKHEQVNIMLEIFCSFSIPTPTLWFFWTSMYKNWYKMIYHHTNCAGVKWPGFTNVITFLIRILHPLTELGSKNVTR